MAVKTVKLRAMLKRKIGEIKSPTVMRQIHKALAEMCDPYVPFKEGNLSSKRNIQVSEKGVRYTMPYARYQYYGQVYGPNVPIKDKDGNVVGFFTPRGTKKYRTGREISYSTEMHPLASARWDQAMLRDHEAEFLARVREIILKRRKKRG